MKKLITWLILIAMLIPMFAFSVSADTTTPMPIRAVLVGQNAVQLIFPEGTANIGTDLKQMGFKLYDFDNDSFVTAADGVSTTYLSPEANNSTGSRYKVEGTVLTYNYGWGTAQNVLYGNADSGSWNKPGDDRMTANEWLEYKGIENGGMVFVYYGKPIRVEYPTLESVKVMSNTSLKLTFNTEVKLNGSPFGLAMLDANGNYIATQDVPEVGLTAYEQTDKKTIVCGVNTGTLSEFLTARKDLIEQGYTPVLAIKDGYSEQSTNYNSGRVEGVTGIDSNFNTAGEPIVANVKQDGSRDICTIPLIPTDHDDVLKVDKVTPLNAYSYELTFNKAVTSLGGAPFTLALLDSNGKYFAREEAPEVLFSATISATDSKKVICTITNTDKTVKELLSDRQMYIDQDYTPIISIKDNGANYGEDFGNYCVDDVTGADGATLYANKYQDNALGSRDLYVVPISEYVDPYEKLEITKVTQISNSALQIDFSEAVELKDNINFGVRIVGANNYTMPNPDGNACQVWLGGNVWEYVDDTKTSIIWNYTSDISNLIDRTGAYSAYAGDSYRTMFYIGDTTGRIPNAKVDSVTTIDGTQMLAADVPSTTASECAYHVISKDTREELTAISAAIISDNTIEVKFSHDIIMDYEPWVSLRIVDENGKHINNSQYQLPRAIIEVDGDTMRITFDPNMMDIINLEGDWANIDGAVKAVINIEDLSNGDFNTFSNGVVENIRKADGKMLTANTMGDGLDIDLTDERDALVTVESAIQVSNTQIEVTFSEAVEIPYEPYIGLRVYDENRVLKEFTHDEKVAYAQIPFSWSYSDSSKTKILLMFPDNTMNDMLNLTGKYAYLNEGTNKTYLCIEEKPVEGEFEAPGNGLIDNIAGENSKLAANFTTTTGYEKLIIEVEEDKREELTVVSATAISDTEIIVKFSAPIEIDYAPFFCLRFTDEDMNLAYAHEAPMQYYGTWEFTDEKHDTIKWTSNNWNVKDIVAMTGPWAKYKELGYKSYFCIEELQDKEGKEIDVKGNGYIDNIVKADGKMLTANLATFGEGYDGLYVEVKEDYAEPAFYLKKVTAINNQQIALEFNKPVYFEGNPFMAIRYVNDANVLQYDGKTPLQYQGTWKYGNVEKTVLIWTQTFGGSIEAVINQTGKYAKYSDYKVMFCIEEIPADKVKGDVEDGTIHNMYTDGGIKLYSNVVGYGVGWDGVYMPITIDYNYKIPGTGDSGIVYALIGMAVATVGIAVFVIKKRKAHNH